MTQDDGVGTPDARHVPVLLDRCLELLEPALTAPGERRRVVVDATLGLGGHTEAMLQRFPDVHVVGVDRDTEALARAQARLEPFGDRVTYAHAVYDELPDVLADAGLRRVDGVLFDLGVSSMQLDLADRGFAYAQDAPLDMRMTPGVGPTAADVLNTYPADRLARVLRVHGEEKFASSSATASPPPPAAPGDTRPSGPSRRCASRSTTSSPCTPARCPPHSTPSPSAAASSSSPTTRSRTASPSGPSPT